MAGEYGMNLPYQPPQGYGMNYYQPQAPQAMQNYQTQMEARLKGLEQRLYGQPNQAQPNQSAHPQMNQPMQPQTPPAALFMVSTLEEAQNYAPDFGGTRQMFYIESDPDKLGMKQFNIGTGAADFSVYEKMNPEGPTSPAETAQTEPEQETEGYLTDKDIQPIRCQLSDLSAMCIEIKEKLEGMTSGKLSSVDANASGIKSTGTGDDAASAGVDADGGKPASSPKQSSTAAARKPNVAATKGKERAGD